MLITSRLQEVFGGNAVSDEYHIGRHVANLFVTQTYEGQSDIHGKFKKTLRGRTMLTVMQLSSLVVRLLVFKLSARCRCTRKDLSWIRSAG